MITFHRIRPGGTLYIPFESFDRANGAPVTISNFAVGDIKVYKDGSTTERASTNGYTLLDTDGIDFDGITGIHGFSIDLSDNSTADFWACGARYFVVVSTITVDSQTLSFLAATFTIGFEGALLDTFIATLSTQTSFTLNSGPAEDDALNGCLAIIHDQASAVQRTMAVVLDYTGSTKTVTLAAAGTFTVAAKDNVSFLPPALQPATWGSVLTITNNRAEANVKAINDNTTSPVVLDRSARSMVRGTVGSSATTTSIPTSSLSPAAAVADQFKNRVLIFSDTTTTANLRGQSADITANTSGGTLTVSALTTAPVSGDDFVII